MGETMETGLRVCKKCLIREVAGQEKVYETLQRYIADLEPDSRAPWEEYERRLALCKECERLTNGMCKACGCYVELRAATANQSCPYDQW